MRHWNSPGLDPLTDRKKRNKRKKTGANIFLIQYTLCKHISFRPQLSLILAFFKNIPPSDSQEHSYDKTQDRTSAARPITLAHVHYLTTLAFTVQQSHIDARLIAKLSALTSHNSRSESCEFCTSTFSCAIILATV